MPKQTGNALIDLEIEEVSLVGSPANKKKFVLFKSERAANMTDDQKAAALKAEEDAKKAELLKAEEAKKAEETKKAEEAAAVAKAKADEEAKLKNAQQGYTPAAGSGGGMDPTTIRAGLSRMQEIMSSLIGMMGGDKEASYTKYVKAEDGTFTTAKMHEALTAIADDAVELQKSIREYIKKSAEDRIAAKTEGVVTEDEVKKLAGAVEDLAKSALTPERIKTLIAEMIDKELAAAAVPAGVRKGLDSDFPEDTDLDFRGEDEDDE